MTEQPGRQVPVRPHTRTIGGGGGDAGAAAPPVPGAAPEGGGSWFTQQSIRGVPNWALISVAALLAIGGFLWWRSRQSAKTSAQQQTPAGTVAGTTSSTAGQCYDSGGNVVPCTQSDYASQIATLQAEIDNLQGTASVPASYAGTASTPTAAPATTGATSVPASSTAGGK